MPRRMFEPHWKSLAFMVVKDLVSRPSTSKSIMELLQMTEAEFLQQVQTHAIPWLVLKRKTEVIERIAKAQEQAPWKLVMDQISTVLALLLVQDVDDVQEFAQSCLFQVSPEITAQLPLLVQTNPAAVALELLKMAADLSNDRRSRVGFQHPFFLELLLSKVTSRLWMH